MVNLVNWVRDSLFLVAAPALQRVTNIAVGQLCGSLCMIVFVTYWWWLTLPGPWLKLVGKHQVVHKPIILCLPYEARPEWWQLLASVTSILLMTTVLEELRSLQFIWFPTTVFFSVSAPNEIKRKSRLLWARDKKEHGLYFFKLMKWEGKPFI